MATHTNIDFKEQSKEQFKKHIMNKRNSQHWTSQRLIQLSQAKGRAYGVEQEPETPNHHDYWTTQRLLQMSAALSRAYQVD